MRWPARPLPQTKIAMLFFSQLLTGLLSDPINRQTHQSAKSPFFGRATWFEEAAVEREGLGKEKEQGDLEDPQNRPVGTLKQCLF